jgi:hypothetical protein
MTENNEVTKKRQALKAEINGGEYRSLARVILDGTGRIIQRITFSEKPPSFWYNSLVFAIVTLLFCTSIGILLGNTIADLPPEIAISLTLAGLLGGVLFSSSLVIAAALTHNRLLSTLSDSILDAIQSEDDLNNLRSWLATSFNMKGQLLVSLVPALIIFPLLNILFSILTKINIDITTHIVAIIAGFQAFVALPIVLASFTMPHRLSKYQLKLFTVDPSSSEVIDSLSDTLNGILLTVGVLLAFFSVIVVLSIPEGTGTFGFVLLIVPWGRLIVVFISNQYALAKIIHKAKWKTLNGIQAQIEALQEQEEILGEKTLGHINELLDYHNRIRTTRNSAMDIRAGLSLLQSLLLPVIGLLLANLLDIFKLLGVAGGG